MLPRIWPACAFEKEFGFPGLTMAISPPWKRPGTRKDRNLTNPTCWVYFFPADSFGRAGCSGLATRQPAGRLRERICFTRPRMRSG